MNVPDRPSQSAPGEGTPSEATPAERTGPAMRITLLTDEAGSWFVPYGKQLKDQFTELGFEAEYVFHKTLVRNGDICYLLSCSRLVQEEYLARNKHNIVVHASDLPQGKGFSPLQWQILEGKDTITLTLFEAAKEVDAGAYYFKEKLCFDGSELLPELRQKLAEKILAMCLKFATACREMVPVAQQGEESFYPKRTAKDEELDANKPLAELFNRLRVSDNDKFPAFFYMKGHKYILKVYREN
jgi:methionyl-tRNA formyltransferase